MAEALRHRIRAAGLLVVEQRILLVRHEVGGDIWIPPGGGFESECDRNRRRIPSGASFRGDRPAGGRRPAGLRARIRRTRRRALPHGAVHRIDAWRGEPTLANLKGLGGDEFDIREVGWIARDELPGLPSFYPAELADDVWSRLDAPTPSIRHLGLQR